MNLVHAIFMNLAVCKSATKLDTASFGVDFHVTHS